MTDEDRAAFRLLEEAEREYNSLSPGFRDPEVWQHLCEARMNLNREIRSRRPKLTLIQGGRVER